MIGLRNRAWPAYVQVGLQLAGIAVFFLGWEISVRLQWVSAQLIPPPSSLPGAFAREWSNGSWLANVLATAHHYAWGVSIGIVAGIALGYATYLFPLFRYAQEGVARLLRPIPPIAWIPFAIMWFGITEGAAAFIIVMAVFWINYFAAYSSAKSLDSRLFEVCAAFGHRSTYAQLTRVIIPGTANGVVGGIRASLGIGWFAVLVAELFGVRGLGQRMMEASGMLATDIVLLYMATIALLYTLTDACLAGVSNMLIKWRT